MFEDKLIQVTEVLDTKAGIRDGTWVLHLPNAKQECWSTESPRSVLLFVLLPSIYVIVYVV